MRGGRNTLHCIPSLDDASQVPPSAIRAATTRHLAAELAPPQVVRHAAPGLLRMRARWRSYLARYAACLGDPRSPGSLRTRLRAAYLDALHRDA